MLEVLKTFPNFTNPSCAGTLDYFFPDSMHEWEERTESLRKICGGCPHKVDCLQYALENEIEEGFWGGLTPKERSKLQPKKENDRNKRYREIQEYLKLGLTEDEIVQKLLIRKQSLKRTLLRGKRKGL